MRPVVSNGISYRFHCDAIVIHEPKNESAKILAGSIAGPGMAVKAFRAAVQSGRNFWPSFDWTPASAHGGRSYIMIPDDGLRLSQPHKLDYGLVQISFAARMPNLLTSRYPETVWQHLDKATTTPLKREWMPFIIDTLRDSGRLITPAIQHNLAMAICRVDDAALDQIVRSGIKHGRIKI